MTTVLAYNHADGVFDEVLVAGVLRIQRPLSGVQDGVNRTFTTPEMFDPDTVCVVRNGNRQYRGGSGDFQVSESGGPGSGYDTVTFAAGLEPLHFETLFADYIET